MFPCFFVIQNRRIFDNLLISRFFLHYINSVIRNLQLLIFYIAHRRISHMSQLQESTVLSEIRSNKIILPSLDELSSQLEQKMAQMTDFEKSGKYTEAENCKENVQKLKNEVHQKKLQNMVLGHKRQKRRIQKLHQEELNQVTTFWTNKISDFNSEAQKLKEEMETRHQSEIAAAKTQLEEQISNKMKESSECLNLRKMEEQMAKQKKYNEAHLIQQKIIEMEKKEKEIFQKQRQAKIQAVLMSLRNKQKTQRQALMKKTKSSQNELLKDKQIQINRVKHKNENIMKQLKSQQQKEVLAHKGQIKSKVTVSSVKSRSKIVLSTIN